MPSPNPSTVGSLCDAIVESLVKFPKDSDSKDASDSRESFVTEVQTLRKFSDLIERVRKARPAQSSTEEAHWGALGALMKRCRRSLQSLQERLVNTETEEYELHYNEPWKIHLDDPKPIALSTLRAHVNLYTQTLQMSLQAFNLIHQQRNRPSGENFQNHVNILSSAFVDLKHVLSHRNSLIDRESEHSIIMDDAFCIDVERCIRTAEGMARTVIQTVHELDVGLSYSPPQTPVSTNGDGHTAAQSVNGARPSQEHGDDDDRPAVPEKNGNHDQIAIRTRELPPQGPPPRNSLPQVPPLQTSPPQEPVPQEPPPEEPLSAKSSDGFEDAIAKLDESTYEEYDDPEPGFEDGFPAEVYAELVSTLQREIERELQAQNYLKAETAHLKMFHYLEDRERHCGITFDNRNQMTEALADIYVKSKQLDKAKAILGNLLKLEYKESDRKWRLYHSLAEVYLAQKRLTEAEKFAKRAYIGREKMFGKGHGLILQSAALLAQIYDQQGEKQSAQVFRNLYDSAVYSQKAPQISKHVGTKRVKWNPDISVNINEVNKTGKTPLVQAITCSDEEMLQHVLHSGADLEFRGNDDVAPLMHAVARGNEKIAGVLLSRGAQVDSLTAEWTPLHKAVEMGDLAMIRLLLANDANLEQKAPKKYIPHKEPRNGRKSADLDSEDDDDSEFSDSEHGWTPLLRACQSGKESVIRLLLDKGADIEARNPSKATPLICAAEGQDEVVIDLLLMRGAKIEAEDEFGWKPLHRTTINKGGVHVAKILLDHDANINAVCAYRKTPLHYAIEKNDESMATFLLRSDADIEARDIALRTPLHTAIECRQENMVFFLLESGADAKAKDKAGRDALNLATHTLRKSPEIVKLLTKHKRSNSNGTTSPAAVGRGTGSGLATRMGSLVDGSSASITSPSIHSNTGFSTLSGDTLGGPITQTTSSNSWWRRGTKKKKDGNSSRER